jgi:hypothetical protein
LCLTGPFAPGAADFTAVKTGDLNASWQGTGNRSVDGPVYFHTLNQRFEAGEMLEVTVYAPDMQAVRAFQLALGWDPTVLAYLGMEGLLVPESQTMTYDQEIRACGYTTEEGLGKNWRPGVFTLRFQAQQTGTLKKCLFVKNENLAAEAYNVDGQTFAVVLDFVEPDPTAFSFRPVQPNPASNRIQAPFTLSEACDVAFDLTDALGRSVFTQTAWFEAGEHVQTFDVSNLDGIVTVRISAAGQSKAQRVVVKR